MQKLQVLHIVRVCL